MISIAVSEMLDFSLFTNVSFNIIFVSILVMMLAYFIPYGYTSKRASSLGVEPSQASLLISILGQSLVSQSQASLHISILGQSLGQSVTGQ